ncbi:MAG: MBL fold metallo-hydrolase [Candidatus Nealsonbacteria bacterium]
MHIIWHGQSFFQIQISPNKGEQVVLAVDPYDESIGLKPPSFAADVLLITHDHHDHNNKKAVRGTPFLIEGPGEYEIKDIFIQGVASFHDNVQGKERGSNTIYTIESEGLKICHLGDLGQKELTTEQLEALGNIDILMVPVGGVYTIDSKEASRIISQIEPRIVIPMHYHVPKLKIKLDDVDKFLKEMGRKAVVPQPKLVVKPKDLPQDISIVLLQI